MIKKNLTVKYHMPNLIHYAKKSVDKSVDRSVDKYSSPIYNRLKISPW